AETGDTLGIKQLMKLLQDEFPHLKYGYFNPPIERIKGRFEADFAH
ncbi:MAG: radical SAM protein, partial [Flavisolibacter sp.]|nr:radical SAM protein [Flavisolibacter sp.]